MGSCAVERRRDVLRRQGDAELGFGHDSCYGA